MSDEIKLSGNERIEKVQELLDKHFESIKFIIDDYMVGSPEMCDEIEVVNERLKDDIHELELTEDFDYLYEHLKKMYTNDEDIDFEKLVEFVVEDDGHFLLTEELTRQGFTCIKIENMDKKSKLKEFLQTELFPFYNDQITFLQDL